MCEGYILSTSVLKIFGAYHELRGQEEAADKQALTVTIAIYL